MPVKRLSKTIKRLVLNFKRFLTREKRYDAAFDGNAAKLYLGIEGSFGDESCTLWRYKVVGGKIKRNTSGLILPITDKAVIMYYNKGGPGSWYPKGYIGTTYKIVLYKNYIGKIKIVRPVTPRSHP